MSSRLAAQLLGRSKYHEAGGSARHAGTESTSQRSSQNDTFSQFSSLDDGGGGHLSARRSSSVHQYKAPPLSVSKFGGSGGSDAGNPRATVDHAMQKRVADQEGRLAEQAVVIKRLEELSTIKIMHLQ